MTSPVQVLVFGFEQPQFSGEVRAEFARLRAAGIVRLLDLLLVTREEDGSLETVMPPPGDLREDAGRLAAALLAESEGSTDGPVSPTGHDDHAMWSLADAIPVGTTAAVALIEHTWAEPLRDAVTRAGGAPLDETWLAREDAELLGRLLSDQAKG
jgi:uncharacterized membrane protein